MLELQVVSVENTTRVPVYDFWFDGMNISIMDNQRKDLRLDIARAMVKQYPFLTIITEVADIKADLARTMDEVKTLQDEVKAMRKTEEFPIEAPFVPKPKTDYKVLSATCQFCGKVFKKMVGLSTHMRHQHTEEERAIFKKSLTKNMNDDEQVEGAVVEPPVPVEGVEMVPSEEVAA